jgi:hypothetical protein
MSIGNLKDQGGKGTNYPWQLKMLMGIDKLLALLSGGSTSFLAPQARAPRYSITSTTGSTTANVYSFSIANVGSAAGTVDGQSLPVGVTVNFDAGALNNTLGSLAYNATGTTFIITYVS